MSEIKLPEVELNIYSKNTPVEVTVVENYVATKDSSPNYVRHITFDISGTDLVENIRVGQSVGIFYLQAKMKKEENINCVSTQSLLPRLVKKEKNT